MPQRKLGRTVRHYQYGIDTKRKSNSRRSCLRVRWGRRSRLDCRRLGYEYRCVDGLRKRRVRWRGRLRSAHDRQGTSSWDSMKTHTEGAAAAWRRATNIGTSDDGPHRMRMGSYRRVVVDTAFIFKLTRSATPLQSISQRKEPRFTHPYMSIFLHWRWVLSFQMPDQGQQRRERTLSETYPFWRQPISCVYRQ